MSSWSQSLLSWSQSLLSWSQSLLFWFWPVRTGITLFDYWTIAHFSFWWVIGSTLVAFRVDRALALAGCMVVAYAWEVFEHFAEAKWPQVWLTPESWVNSLVADPLMCLVAILLAYHGFEHWRP